MGIFSDLIPGSWSEFNKRPEGQVGNGSLFIYLFSYLFIRY